MSNMYGKRGFLDQYRQTSSAAAEHDPHRVIAMLLAGAIERIRLARLNLERGDIAGKAQAIGAAMSIVDGLRLSLDHEAGGEIAAGLESLYDYASLRLVEANAHNDDGRLREVEGLLGEIESAWAAIPRQMGAAAAHGAGGTAP
ncbi:flagellar protein FliS [Rehaibacterium terrae]|uniref:Flagellar secretion chaperone FliS n=2 Tax=Rehaibacterium terrae TaxID=1341696 RepID=A0A7W8DFG3_9GAMM|nr:flagellar protein FliS [Rehaibacterium terrae]